MAEALPPLVRGAPEVRVLPLQEAAPFTSSCGWELGRRLRGPPPTTQQPAPGMPFGPPAPHRHHTPEAKPRLRQTPNSSGSSSGGGRPWPTPNSPDSSQQALRVGPRRQRRRLPPKLLLGWLVVAAATLIRAVALGQVLPFGWGELRPVVWPPREPSHRANLLPLTVLNQSTDACAQALRIPKVALLFLTQGRMPHERTWRLWFQAAEGRLPVAPLLMSGACSGGAQGRHALQQARAACAPGRELLEGSAASALTLQHLFSVYVHVPFGKKGFPPTSLFGGEGTVIAEHVPTAWGSHTLVEATRALLWAAARDPANQRFVLLSESDIPLYDPLTFHAQLVAENLSHQRLPAHPAQRNQGRYQPVALNQSYWRKSSQWFTLTRSHAEAVLEDIEVFRDFETHCWSGWVREFVRWKDCYSDEHYVPTLLAVRGLEEECACEAWRGPAFLEWTGGAHPRSFLPEEINSTVILRAREVNGTWQNCSAAAVQADAARMYVRYGDLLEDSRDEMCRRLAGAPAPTPTRPLAATCAVTARKFPEDTADVVYALFRGCEGASLGLLDPDTSGNSSTSIHNCKPLSTYS